MKNSLKNKLKNQYENLSETPSKSVWESIQNELENNEKTVVISEKKFSYWKIAALFLMLVSLGFLFKFYFNRNSNSIDNQIVKKENNSVQKTEKSQKATNLNSEKVVENSISNHSENQNQIVENRHEKVLNQTKKLEKNQQNFNATQPELKLVQSQKLEIQKEESPKILKNQEVFENKNLLENKQVMAENIKPKEKTKYVTAEDLLFEREASQTLKEHQNSQKSLGTNLKIQKPKEIKILGVTVYSDDKE